MDNQNLLQWGLESHYLVHRFPLPLLFKNLEGQGVPHISCSAPDPPHLQGHLHRCERNVILWNPALADKHISRNCIKILKRGGKGRKGSLSHVDRHRPSSHISHCSSFNTWPQNFTTVLPSRCGVYVLPLNMGRKWCCVTYEAGSKTARQLQFCNVLGSLLLVAPSWNPATKLEKPRWYVEATCRCCWTATFKPPNDSSSLGLPQGWDSGKASETCASDEKFKGKAKKLSNQDKYYFKAIFLKNKKMNVKKPHDECIKMLSKNRIWRSAMWSQYGNLRWKEKSVIVILSSLTLVPAVAPSCLPGEAQTMWISTPLCPVQIPDLSTVWE